MHATQATVDTGADRRKRRLAPLFLALTAAWVVLWFVHTLGYWEDDAYIHLEFARSLARGQGFAFNGHVVYGDTSPLWVWLLVAFHSVIPGWIAAGKTLAAVGAVFALGGVYAFARSLLRELDAATGELFAAAMLLVLVVNPYFGYWAFSGMEALAAAGLVCWGLVLVTPREHLRAHTANLTAPLAPGRFLLACLCAGLAPLLRPEMGFYTGLLGLLLLVRWVNLPLRFRSKLGLFFAGFALVAGPGVAWGLYALRTFGGVLPNTNAAKRAGPEDSVVRHLLQIYGFGFPLVLLGLAAIAIWLIAARLGKRGVTADTLLHSLPAAGWLLFLWSGVTSLFYIADHTYVQTRYIFVTAPVLTVAILAIVRKLRPRVYGVGVIFAVIFGVTVSLDATWPLINNKIGVDRDYAALAAFLRTLPPHDPVAHYSIGEAAFLSEHPLIDLGGITRPGVIPFLWDKTDDRRLWWAHAQGARYDVVDHQPEPQSTLVWRRRIPTTGWFLNPRRYRGTEILEVWKLPPVPTIPLPPDMQHPDAP